jgi:hypothetical protein
MSIKTIPQNVMTAAENSWRCSESHVISLSYSKVLNSLKNNRRACIQCRRIEKNITLKDYKSVAKKRGWKYMKKTIPKYTSMPCKASWRCSAGHYINSSYNNVSIGIGRKCMKCRIRKLVDYKQLALLKKWKYIAKTIPKTTNISAKKSWRCNADHIVSASYASVLSNINNKYGCAKCTPKGSVYKKTLEDYIAFAKEKKFEYQLDEIPNDISVSMKNAWKCLNCNYLHSGSYRHFYRRTCSHCTDRSESKPEKLARKIMTNLCSKIFIKIRPKWLDGLELDGYDGDSLAFEYNGAQHDKYNDFFHKNIVNGFEKQQERDLRKRKICKERGITLITIPHIYDHTKPDEMEKFIRSELKRKGIKIKEKSKRLIDEDSSSEEEESVDIQDKPRKHNMSGRANKRASNNTS